MDGIDEEYLKRIIHRKLNNHQNETDQSLKRKGVENRMVSVSSIGLAVR